MYCKRDIHDPYSLTGIMNSRLTKIALTADNYMNLPPPFSQKSNQDYQSLMEIAAHYVKDQ